MKSVLQPWQLLLLILAGWINRRQQEVLEYLRIESQVLKEKLGKKRILLTDDQRRRLAVKGILFGDRSLRNAAQEFVSHYHADRNHQGINNRIIEPGDEVRCTTGKIACRERLGGMPQYYCRRAA